MTKQRILFITTGGTIASVRTQQGLKPVLTSEELLAHLPESQRWALLLSNEKKETGTKTIYPETCRVAG